MPSTARRAFLGTLAATSSFAGCLGESDSPPEPVDLTLTNHTDERHDVDVLIELRGEALFDRTLTLHPSGAVEDSFAPPKEPGEATVSVAVDGGDPTTSAVRLGPSTGLTSMAIVVEEGGSVSVLVGRE